MKTRRRRSRTATATENGSHRNSRQRRNKERFSASSHAYALIIALSSLWAETRWLFLKKSQDGESARPPAAASDTSSNMAGRKINWQLNDTPYEDDKRHLVAAQEEVR